MGTPGTCLSMILVSVSVFQNGVFIVHLVCELYRLSTSDLRSSNCCDRDEGFSKY
jgi:hypothetical protein